MAWQETAEWCALCILILIGFVVRLSFLSAPILYDEAYTFTQYASKPLYVGLTDYSAPNNHLFHTSLVHVAYRLLGNEPWMIRLPALVAGIFLIPAAYWTTRLIYNRHAALLTAACVACSAPLVRYSVLARGYSVLCLIFMLLLGVAARLQGGAGKKRWLLFSVLAALGFYTIPVMLYPFGMVVVWLILSIVFDHRGEGSTLSVAGLMGSLAMVGVLTFALYLPVFVMSGFQTVFANDMVSPKSWGLLATKLPASLGSIWGDWNKEIPYWLSGGLLFGFVISLIFHRRLSPYRVPVLAGGILWIIPAVLVQRVIPPVRAWLFLLPLYFAMASAGLGAVVEGATAKLGRMRVAAIPVLSITLAVLMAREVSQVKYIYDPIGTLWEGEQIALFLKDYLEPGDKVVVPHASAVMLYYFILHGVPTEYLEQGPNRGSRIVLVVCESKGRLEDNLRRQGASLRERMDALFPDFGPPQQLRRYEFSTVYELRRKSPPDVIEEARDNSQKSLR